EESNVCWNFYDNDNMIMSLPTRLSLRYDTRLYLASHKVYGGEARLLSKEKGAKNEGNASLLAALDYYVSIQSKIFISASPRNRHSALVSYSKYGELAAVKLLTDVEGLGTCEYTTDRGIGHACHIGGVAHFLEGYTRHEVGTIDVDMIDVVWEATMNTSCNFAIMLYFVDMSKSISEMLNTITLDNNILVVSSADPILLLTCRMSRFQPLHTL
ncbi:hypothetical protein GIB67_003661, partial [Kingdonia uniflora]